ncbi:hypothetical protein KI387_010655, partial [Taxus chinensis]
MKEGEEKGMVGNYFPNRHDDNKLAGLFITAVTKEQNDDGLDLGKRYEDIPNTHEQARRNGVEGQRMHQIIEEELARRMGPNKAGFKGLTVTITYGTYPLCTRKIPQLAIPMKRLKNGRLSWSSARLVVRSQDGRLVGWTVADQALPVYNKAVLTVDIGGGSTEFVLGYCGEVIHATSLKLGHIRLTESFLRNRDDKLQESHIEELRRHIRATFSDSNLVEKVREIGFEMAIGSSGTIESIQQAIHQGHAVELRDGGDSMPVFFQAFRGCEFTNVELNVIVAKLCKTKSNEERGKLLGLTENRLDSLVAGAILLQEIFGILGIDTMTVSSYALREGVIADTLAKTCNEYSFVPNVRWSSVISLARKFNNKKRMKSDMHSVQLAKELLEGLQRCKENGHDCFSTSGSSIDENDIELMESAILLHSIGMFINLKGYHKHSYYLIKNNKHLHGYSSMEIEIIALLARYHRKKFPRHKHDCFAKLPQEAQRKVRALSAIIRIAVALERSNFSAIQQVDVMYEKGAYTI